MAKQEDKFQFIWGGDGSPIDNPSFIKIIDNEELGLYEKHVLLVICRFALLSDGTHCYPSRQTIANKSGCSLRKVAAVLPCLVDMGYLEIQTGGSNLGTNIYTVYDSPKNKMSGRHTTSNFVTTNKNNTCNSLHEETKINTLNNGNTCNKGNKLATQETTQKTLFNIPHYDPSQPMSKREQSLLRIDYALRTGKWELVTATDYAFYYERVHNESMAEKIFVVSNKMGNMGIGLFKRNFVEKLPANKVVEYINAFLKMYPVIVDAKYKNKCDLESFRHTWLIDKVLEKIKPEIEPVEDVYGVASDEPEQRTEQWSEDVF